MTVTSKFGLLAVLAGAMALGSTSAYAANVSFTGTFAQDDQLQFFTFVPTAATTIVSLGYAGGTNSDGNVISAGGFDTFFSVFDLLGNEQAFNDNFTDVGGVCGPVPTDNGNCFDAYLSNLNLVVGDTYTLVLSQPDNVPVDTVLADGFTRTGQGNFTCPQGFCDVSPSQRNGNWAIDFLNVSAAAPISAGVPEPRTFLLTGLSGVVLAFLRRRSIASPRS